MLNVVITQLSNALESRGPTEITATVRQYNNSKSSENGGHLWVRGVDGHLVHAVNQRDQVHPVQWKVGCVSFYRLYPGRVKGRKNEHSIC